MSKHYSSEISTDDEGNVTLTFNKKSWDRLIELSAQVMHMDDCARAAWKAGNSHGALIYYDRASNGPLARLHGMTPPEVHAMVAEAMTVTSEGK